MFAVIVGRRSGTMRLSVRNAVRPVEGNALFERPSVSQKKPPRHGKLKVVLIVILSWLLRQRILRGEDFKGKNGSDAETASDVTS